MNIQSTIYFYVLLLRTYLNSWKVWWAFLRKQIAVYLLRIKNLIVWWFLVYIPNSGFKLNTWVLTDISHVEARLVYIGGEYLYVVRQPLNVWTKFVRFFVIKPTRCTNFTNLFCHETLHVSDSSSVHHQDFIHCTLSNGICHTGL